MLSEICLQAILLKRCDILEEYISQYIFVQKIVFEKDVDPLNLISYMALPQILCRNHQEQYVTSIFKSLDQKLLKYDLKEKGDVEKILSLPYLCFMYKFLEENEKANEVWKQKNNYYSEFYKTIK